ncbi:MAG: ATP-dependent DNA helicase RecG [Caldisericia bacterium]
MEELEKIISVFTLERKRKFDDRSVIGGFSKFILSNLNNLEIYKVDINKIRKLIERYEDEERENRKKIHKEILDEILDSLVKQREIDIEKIPGVGEKRKEALLRLGIRTSYDLIYFFPRKYIDFGKLTKISSVKRGEYAQIQGEVLGVEKKLIRKGLNILKVKFFDGTGVIFGIWFNQIYLEKFFRKGKKFLLMGVISYNFGEWQIENPDFEEISNFKENSEEKIISIYPQTSGLSSKMISNYIKESIKLTKNILFDPLPQEIIKKRELTPLSFSIENIHFPSSNNNLYLSEMRLKYEELFLFQTFLYLRRIKIKEKMGFKYEVSNENKEKFIKSLPFNLTDAQKKVINEIEKDLTSGKVMNRLLHGEVGSGKTVISAYALYLAALNKTQGAMMSPTEILAIQTFNILNKFLSPFNIRVELLTGSTKNKDEIKKRLREGEIDIIVGTHALIEEDVEFKNLTLAIVDEQHRFGVIQRANLVKKGEYPHTLVLSATPIPRTLALTLYGDLDISMIDELPPGRKPVKTIIFTNEEKERAYDFIKKKLNEKEKIYVVCPFIEENEKMEVAAVKKKYEEFKERFKNVKIEFLHGRMKGEEKERIIKEFREGDTQILISTSVVEVGIDIPEATVILVEDANRFGLLTLHQLRGRVGRGEKESFCILLLSTYDKDALRRLRVLERTNSGFEVSEWDLKYRGTGELGGEKQHGLIDFKIINLLNENDIKLLEIVKEDVANFLKKDSVLNYPFLIKELSIRFKDFKYLDIS